MALTAVEKTIQGLMDRFAYQKQAAVTVCTGGTDVWDRVDAAANEVFENRVKGSSCTDLDTSFAAMTFGQWTNMATVLSTLANYCVTDLGLASFDAYLTSKRWRIDKRARDLWVERYGAASISLANVHGAGDGGAAAPGLELGNLLRGGTLTAGTDLTITDVSCSPVLGRVTVIGADDWEVTATLKQWDDTTEAVAETVLGTGNSGAVGDTYVWGKEALTYSAAAGQGTVEVADTTQFKVGQTVLLTQWTGAAPAEVWTGNEWAVIESLYANQALHFTTNLKHAYTTAGYVYPCYKGVSAATGTGGTALDRIYFYPAPDRRLAL